VLMAVVSMTSPVTAICELRMVRFAATIRSVPVRMACSCSTAFGWMKSSQVTPPIGGRTVQTQFGKRFYAHMPPSGKV
jgi:hypothetical protein